MATEVYSLLFETFEEDLLGPPLLFRRGPSTEFYLFLPFCLVIDY